MEIYIDIKRNICSQTQSVTECHRAIEIHSEGRMCMGIEITRQSERYTDRQQDRETERMKI